MEGWIKLHRQLLESEIFASSKGLRIWIWLLLKVQFDKKYFPIKIGAGESIVKLERGQLLFGRFKAEEELGIDGSTIYKWLKKLEQMGMIELQSNNHYTIVSIANFDKYNEKSNNHVTAEGTPEDSHVTTEGQPRNTYKNDKNDKNEEEIKEGKEELHPLQILIKGFANVSSVKNQLTFEEAAKLSAEFSENEIKEIIEAMENKKDLQKKYTSVNLTIRGWLRLRNTHANKRIDPHHIGKQDYSVKL